MKHENEGYITNTCPNCGGKLEYLSGDLEFPYAYGCDECGLVSYSYTKEAAKELFYEHLAYNTSMARD